MNLTGATRLFPIIGDPVTYLESPTRLTATLRDREQDAACIPMQVAESDLAVVMAGLAATGNVDGLLVTMPHKHTVFDYCSTRSQRAALSEVVSIVRRDPGGGWHGDMLDGLAFVKAQVDRGARPDGARALLLGAGGAGRAIAIALIEAGVTHLTIHDPDDRRAADLTAIVNGLGRGRAVSGPPDPTTCDLVCNATPLGMKSGDPLPCDPALLTATMFVGDVIAGHGLTPLLGAAQAVGCRTANGGHMVEAAQQLMIDFLLAPVDSVGP